MKARIDKAVDEFVDVWGAGDAECDSPFQTEFAGAFIGALENVVEDCDPVTWAYAADLAGHAYEMLALSINAKLDADARVRFQATARAYSSAAGVLALVLSGAEKIRLPLPVPRQP